MLGIGSGINCLMMGVEWQRAAVERKVAVQNALAGAAG
jgi:hypothetical protein